MYMYIDIYTYDVYTYIHIIMNVCISLHICVYVHVYVCMCIYIYIYAYIHIIHRLPRLVNATLASPPHASCNSREDRSVSNRRYQTSAHAGGTQPKHTLIIKRKQHLKVRISNPRITSSFLLFHAFGK